MHFLAYGVAALPDARADRGDQVFWLGAEFEAHAADPIFDDSPDGSAPPGVERSNGFSPAIGNQNRNAIGSLDPDQESGLAAHDAVPLAGMLPAGEPGGVHDRTLGDEDAGMDLAERDERGRRVSGYSFGQQLAVASYVGAVVFSRKPQVELAWRLFCAVGAGHAAAAGAEAMPEPWNLIPARYLEPFDPISSDGGSRRGWREFFSGDGSKMTSAKCVSGFVLGFLSPAAHQSCPVRWSVDLSNVRI
jgi:hypothetical protein